MLIQRDSAILSAIRRRAKFSTVQCELIETTSRSRPSGFIWTNLAGGVAFCNGLGTGGAVGVGGHVFFRGLSQADRYLRVGDGEPPACSAV